MEQYIVFFVILGALVLFIQGKVRYDFVALIALLILALFGIVAPSKAFLGFGHPAIITVAAILVVSSALLKTGAVNQLVELLNKGGNRVSFKIAGLTMMTAVLSSFMNNVGALALVMPIAIKIGKEFKISASYLLMPVAFASLLGGLVTEIGTPPNLIISMYRAEVTGQPFRFFDFAPVGIGLTVIGVLFIAFIGWRFIPKRKNEATEEDLFKVEDYLVELFVPEDSKVIGSPLKDFMVVHKIDLNVLSIMRKTKKIVAPLGSERLQAQDLLVVKTDHNELAKLLEKTRLTLKGTKMTHDDSGKMLSSEDYTLVEVVLRDDSPLVGRTAIEVQLRNRYGVNLVAVSRKGHSSIHRLKTFRFNVGDILLLQARVSDIKDTFSALRCLPLAERGVELMPNNQLKNRVLAISLFAGAIALTTFGLLPVQVAFSVVAVLMVLLGILTTRDFYEAIEWPIIIMLGALLPVGEALESTGGAETIATAMMRASSVLSPTWMLVLLMATTMVLTNLINNAAAAVLMAPIAISLSAQLGVHVDPFLMAVAVSSSCAFLTPIGHQSNTLIMGPGGYRFGDYWPMGLPISLIVLAIGTPLILWFWPM